MVVLRCQCALLEGFLHGGVEAILVDGTKGFGADFEVYIGFYFG